MCPLVNLTFDTSSSVTHFQFTVDGDKKRIAVECIGMGMVWNLSDHKWDYPLDDSLLGPIDKALSECGAVDWGCSGDPSESDGRFWNLEAEYDDGRKIVAEGFGGYPEGFPIMMKAMKDVVTRLSKEIYLDGTVPDAYYFSYSKDGMGIVTYTVFSDGEVSIETVSGGAPETVKKKLPGGGMEVVNGMVKRSNIPFMGFSSSNKDCSFASQAVYLGGRMVSNTCSGQVSEEWTGLHEKLKAYFDVLD